MNNCMTVPGFGHFEVRSNDLPIQARRLAALFLTMPVLVLSAACDRTESTPEATVELSGDYMEVTRQQVNAALAPDAEKSDIILAEAFLTGLGWQALYGNGECSDQLADDLRRAAMDAYASDGVLKIFDSHTFDTYVQMLEVLDFPPDTPVPVPSAFVARANESVKTALVSDAAAQDFRQAEGSVRALGWATLYGYDRESIGKARQLMEAAENTWPGDDEVYTTHTQLGYSELINLGKLAASSGSTPAAGDMPVVQQCVGEPDMD